MKTLEMTKLNKAYSDDYVCELTKVMDENLIGNFPKDSIFQTYMYDPKEVVDSLKEDGMFHTPSILGEDIKDKGYIAIRFPGATRGHIAINSNLEIVEIKLYEDTCFGKGSNLHAIYKKKVSDDIQKFIGYKIVVK